MVVVIPDWITWMWIKIIKLMDRRLDAMSKRLDLLSGRGNPWAG